MNIHQYTEDSITLEFEDVIDPDTNRLIVNLNQEIIDKNIKGYIESVISFTKLVIYFDPLELDRSALIEDIRSIDLQALLEKPLPANVIEIPVCYEGDYGPDLVLFEESGLSPQDVIDLHANREYLVYMLGFMPGFVYLGGLDQRLYKDRLNNPRTNIPAGSVGIGGKQTGVYPFDSPGGWNLLGRTPVKLYDTRRGDQTILYQPGDKIVFKPISMEEYDSIQAQVEAGTYEVKVTEGGSSHGSI